jgi:hypothetical protein
MIAPGHVDRVDGNPPAQENALIPMRDCLAAIFPALVSEDGIAGKGRK